MNVFVHLFTSTLQFLYKLASTQEPFGRISAPPNVVATHTIEAEYFTNNKVRTMRKTRLQKMAWLLPMLFLTFMARGQDLSLRVYTSATTTTVGGQLTFKISVRNDAKTAVTGVQVTSAIPIGTTYVSDDGASAYNNATGLWTIGAIGAAVDSVVLNVTVQVVTEGVVYQKAEITAMTETDGDSTPGNGSVIEDDFGSACATIPIHYNCRDDINALASAPTGYTNYQWYKNGAPISGATLDTYRIKETGDFNFSASTPTTSCPASLCCPITIVRDSCMSLGNLVFEDKDNNGTFNGTDAGLNGVQVQLHSLGIGGVKGDASDKIDSTITTANGGLYLFNNLNPGRYYVKLTGVGIPTGYVSSTGGGPNDYATSGTFEPGISVNTDNADHGSQMGTMVMSSILTLTLNGEPTGEDGAANTNLTVDFGLYKPACVLPKISVATPSAVCAPLTIDVSTLTVTDAATTVGNLTYFGTAQNAVDSTNALTSTVISATQTVWIRKTNLTGRCFDTVSVKITINPKPVYADASVTVCAPANVNLTTLIANYATIVNPTWTTGSVAGTAVADATKVTPSVSTTYFLVGENATGCKDTAQVVVTVTPKPNLGTDKTLVCSGITAPTVYDFATTGTWVVLTQPATAAASISASGSVTNMTVAGQYTFEITVNGCKDTASVTIPTCGCTSPDISATSPAAVCAPLTIDVSTIVVTDAANIAGALTYYSTATDAFNKTNALASTIISASQTVWIRKTDAGGFCFDTVSVKITINPKPVYADASVTVCAPANVNLTALIANYASIVNPTWTSGSLTGTAVADATKVTPSVSTTYFLVGENATGCKDTAEVAVTVTPKPNLGTDKTLVCSGITAPTVYDFATTGTWVVLTQPATAAAAVSASGSVTNMTIAGQYTFEITVNGCKDTASVTIPTCGCTSPDISATSPSAVCAPLAIDVSTIVVTDAANIAGTLTYYATATDAFNKTNALASTIISASQTVWIRKTDAGGFCFDTVSVKITINPKPVYADASVTVCAPANVNLTTLIANYASIVNPTWTSGSVAGTAVADATKVTPSVSTTYFLVGENATGCKDTAEVAVTVTPKPNLGTDKTLVCSGITAPMVYDFATTGTWVVLSQPATAAASISASGSVTNMTVAGQYTFEITVNGCKDTASVTIPTCGCTSPDISATSPSAVCAPLTIDVSTIVVTDAANIAGALTYYGTATDAFNKTNALASTIISASQTVWIRKTDVGGNCFDTVSVKITINPKPVYADASVTVCAPANVNLTALMANYASIVNPTWTSGSVTGTAVADATKVTPSVSTTYFLVGENATGCKDTAEVAVTVTPKPDLGTDKTLVCSAGATPSTYDFTTTGTWVILTQPATAAATISSAGLAANMTLGGQYTFEITVNGCKDTAVVDVQSCIPTLSLGNLVFNDANNDGIHQNTEGGIQDVRVVLYGVGIDGMKNTADDVKIDSILTNGSGNYLFTGLSAGNYFVKLSSGIPSGMVSSTGDGVTDKDGAGSFEPSNSVDVNDADNGTAMGTMVMSKIITLSLYGEPTNDGDTSSLTNLTVDFGLYTPQLASIGNLVFNDANNDGIRQNTEGSLPNVKVDLYRFDYTTSAYVLVTTQNTDGNGKFLFNNLDSGKYYVKIPVIPTGMSSSTGDGVTDTDGAGAFEPSTSTADNTDKGSKMGTMVVSNPFTLTLGAADTTVDFGFYTPQPLPTLSLGNLVFEDKNNNGVFDSATDVGIENVEVILYNVGLDGMKNTADDVVIDTLLTDQNGNYLFTGLEAGKYFVKLNGGIPSGFVSSTGDGVTDIDNAGAFEPSTSGDVNNADHGTQMGMMVMSDIITLSLYGEPTNDGDTSSLTNLTVDFGLYKPQPIIPTLSLGDLVWNDANNDGIHQNTEGGIPNVRVVLYGVGTDGMKNTADDVKIDSILTNGSGNYLFTGLSAGNYYVKLSSGIPSGMVSSTGDGVTDKDGAGSFEPSNSVDVNDADNGTAMGAMVMSKIITLSLYGEPTNDGDTSSLTNLTVDFGLYTPQLASIGNLVFNDANNDGIRQNTEGSLPSVKVDLYRFDYTTSAYVLVTTQNTDGNGKFLFNNLDSGKYYVKIPVIPTGMSSSTGGGVNDFSGSGAFEPSTSTADNTDKGTKMGTMVVSSPFTLTLGAADTTVDFGFYTPVCKLPDIAIATPAAVCAPATIDAAAIAVTDAAATVGTLTYFGTAQDAVDSTNALASTIISSSRTVWIRKTATAGRCFDTVSVVITINPKPVYADASVTVCAPANVNLTTLIANYATIVNPTWTVSTISGATVSTPNSVTPSVSTTYFVIGENATGCKDTAQVIVTVTPKPNLGIDKTLVCAAGATPSTYDFATTGTWAILTQPATAAATISAAGLAANMTLGGQYTFEITVNGCKDTVKVDVQACIPTLSLGNLVFNDANNDGIHQNTEGGIANVRVVLYGVGTDGMKNTADDVKIDSILTNGSGNYLFTGLSAGNYYVKLSSGIPSGMVSSTGDGVTDKDGAGSFEPSTSTDVNDADNGTAMGTMVMSKIITLSLYGEPTNDGDTSSLTNLTVDFGLYTPQLASIGNLVFNDANNDGIRQNTEGSLPNVKVDLYRFDYTTSAYVLVTTQNTDANGKYLFNNLDSGKYYVKIPVIPTGMSSSTGDGVTDTDGAGAFEPSTSTADNTDKGSKMGTMVVSNPFTLTLGAVDSTVDFGFYTPQPIVIQTLSLGNLVWNDANNDGIHQGTEGGIANVRVVLYGVGTDGMKNTADDVKIDSTLSSGTGNYLFTGLSAGNYFVKLSSGIPSGMVSSTGDGVSDTDGAGSFEPSTSVDINDLDNGTAMGTMVMSKIITLSLYGEPTNDGDTSSLTNLTVDFGLYTPVPIVVNPTMAIGNSVFNDDDNDGLQGVTEIGIPNVRVVLFAVGPDNQKNTADDVKLDSVLTGSNGKYLFTGLNPGKYFVKLSSGIPTGMVSSTGQGPNDTDGAGPYEPSTVGKINDADHGTQMGTMVMSNIITLVLYGEPTDDGDTSSLTNLTIDFGLYQPHLPNATLTIGNLVWFDANNDGIHQAGEAGIKDVHAFLYNVGGDNTKGTADDFVVTDTYTDVNGKYLFPLLSEGNYYVKLNGGVPSGMVSSTGTGVSGSSTSGTYEPSTSVDINDVDNGSTMGTMIMSNMIVLRLYSEPTNDGDLDQNTNLTVDFGFYTPNVVTGSIGNLVWNDVNNDGIRQNTEGSLPNVDVALYKYNTTTSAYDLVNTIQTDANGKYLFTGLAAGQYYVKIPTIPTGMSSSTGDGAGDTDGSGLYEPATGTADNTDRGSKMGTMVISAPLTLAAGAVDTTVDFGFYVPSRCDCALNQDQIAPVLAGVPSNTTLNCDATIPTPTVTATDNCTTVVPITLASTRTNGLCAGNYTLTRTWTATDLCGNTATASQTVTVQDIAAPTFTNVPVNLTLTCGQAIPTAATPSATDNCDNTPTVVLATTTPTATTIVRTWTATDACGNSASTSQTITTTPCKLSLGDLVWNDANNDGLYQNTEGGIPNVRVVLYGVGADGQKNTADDVKIDSVLTSSTGNYLFTNLDAGDYFVKLSSGIPLGMVSSTGDGVADTDGAGAFEPAVANDVNNRDNGSQMGTMVMSNIITLTYFGEPTNDGDTSSLTNLTVDFGLYTPVRPTSTLGNLVWNDANNDGIRQNTEGSIPNVKVDLYKFNYTTSTYDLVTTQNTDVNGKYSFNNLDSGKYYVKLPIIPAGMSSSTGDGPTDNDGAGLYEPSNATGEDKDKGSKMGTMIVSNPFVLTLGAVDSTVDFGLYVPQSLTCDCPSLQDVTAPTLVGLPTNITLNCQDAVPTGTGVTATDNCTPNVAVVITNVTINGTCAANYTISRTWTATDLCGNVAKQTRTITVQDVTAPILASAPANVTVTCNAVPTAATLTAKDTCFATPTVAFVETRVDGTCANKYVLTRTWTATDGCNNSSTVSQIVTVQDVTAPILAAALANVTVECNAVPTAATLTATDNCTTNQAVVYAQTRVDGTCANKYVLTRTWTATDACGNSASTLQTVTVQDTTKPSLVGVPANVTLACGVSAPLAPNVTATDNCGTATAVMNEISSATLVVRTWTATDACGNTSTASQMITLSACAKATIGNLVWNDANNDGIHQNTEGSLPSVKVDLYKFNYTTSTYDLVTTQNTDANGKYLFNNLDSGKYYVKLPIIPTGMSSSTGDGVADLDGVGAYEPSTSTADNTDRGTKMGTMVVSNPFNISVGQVDTTVDFGFYTPTQPRLALSLGNIVWNDANNNGIKDANETGLNGITVVLYGVGTDGLKNTADDQFIDSLTTANGGLYEFTGLNEGKYFVKLTGTGIPTGFVSSTGGGANDNSGAGTFEPSTSNDVDNRDNGTRMGAMVMSNIVILTYYGEPTNDGDTSSLSNLTVDFGLYKPILPQGAIGNLVWNDANNDGIHQNTEGSLPNVKVDLYKFNYTTSTYDLVTTQNTDVNGKYLFNGLDSGRYYVKLPVIPTGMSSSTGGGPTDNDGAGTYEPSTSIADNNDRGTKMGTMVVSNPFVLATNQVDTTVDFGFYVVQSIACDCPSRQDLVAPSLVGVPANMTLNCQDAIPTGAGVTAIDNCTANLSVALSDNLLRGLCPNSYTLVRTWKATDACGNTSTASQVITVQDVTPPVFSNIPANVTVSCGAIVTNAVNPTVKDTCDANPRVTFTETRQNGTCAANYTITRTWTAIDACGNSATASQVVTVQDKAAPTFANVPVNLTLACGQTVPTAVNPTATDSCDANPTVAMVTTNPTATTIVRTWTATDACGNSATTSQTITTPTNCNTPTATIGNLVWNDANNDGIRQNTEGSLPSVKVDLYKFNYTTGVFVLVTTQNTDVNGKYLFNGLDSGRYYVKLPIIPTGMSSSTGNGISDVSGAGAYEPSTATGDNKDKGSKMGTMVVSNPINITIGQVDTTVDFGFYTPVVAGTFDLALTKKLVPRTGGVVVNNGDVIRFRMTVINQGSVNAHDIKIKDYIPTGLQFSVAQNTAALTGNANDWAADSTLFVNDLNAGASASVDIILTVNHLARDTFFLNKSEVIFATNTEGSLVNTPDVDSQADSNPANDKVGGDNIVNNTNGDEDDHDFAYVIDYPNKDPIGYIYCDKTGKLLMGGTISVTGPGIVYIIEDGSTGRYQFFTDGTPGTYSLTYTHPDGFPLSTTCAARPGALNLSTADGTAIDRDGVRDGFVTVGTGTVTNGYLLDKTCANNPYYTSFTAVASTDAEALHNNLPVQCSFIGAITCSDNNANSIRDAVDTKLDSVKIYLYNCLTNAVLDSTISVNGKYSFDGLRSGSYKVRAVTPNNYRLSIANLSNNPLLDSRLDANGFSDCMVLNFGECDTTKGNVCFIPQIFDLALRKTLTVGQPTIVSVGDTVNYTVQVFNQGTIPAYDVDVVDYIPTGMLLVDATWRTNGAFAAKRIAGPIAIGANTSVNIKLKVTGTDNQYVNFAEISRASDRTGGANVTDIDSQADSTATNDRGGRWNVVGENDNITGGINGDEDDSDPAVITVNNIRNGCGIALNPTFTTRGFCALGETQFTAATGFNTYFWNFGDGNTGVGANVTHEYGTPTGGNYAVTLFVTNASGCSDSITKQVIINPMVWANAGVDKTICAGDSVQLGAQGGTHYSWLPAGTLNNGDIFNPIAKPTVTTTYYAFVSNDFGCSGTDSVTVFVNPQPTIVARTGSVSTCSNGVMPIRIQLNQAIASYRITGSAGYSGVVVSGSTITFNATLNGSLNNMSVSLTGSNGCTVVDTFRLFLAGNPRADFVVIEPFCKDAETTLLFTGSATAAARLVYDLQDGVIVRQSAATATRPLGDTTVVRFPTFGSKLLKLAVNDGGCVDNATKSILVRKSPKTVLANKDTTICPNVCVPLYGTAGIFDCVYTWTPATGLSSTNTASTVACPLVTTTYTLTIMDINGCSSSMPVTITVTTPPVLVGVPANITVECNNIPAPATTVRTSTGLPTAFKEVKTAGSCPNSYTLTRTWTATNYCNLTTTGTQIVTVQDITPPILANVPRNVTISCDETLPTANGVTATDNCDANPLITSNEVKTPGTCANNYTITRTWIARDACNNTATASQVITVRDINAPMLMNVPMNTTLACDAALPSATVVSAMDNCDAAPRVTFADVKTNGYCPNSYTLARTWTATDACGNTSTASQVIIVLDLTKPVLANVPANTTIECNTTPPTSPTVTASDNCDASLLRVVFAEKRTNNACGYTLTRTWTAIDACGNAGTGVQVISVEDRTAPSFGNTPATVTIDCIEKLNTVRDPSVSDACDPNPTVTVARSVTDSTCANRKKIVRTYSAKDICGNTQIFTQTINVFDNVGPVITPRNPLLAGLVSGDTLTMSCEDIRLFQLGDATAVDNCLGCTPTLVFEDLARRRGTCPIDGYSLLMECLWTATDCCGNKTEWRIFIKVTDNQAPVLTGVPANITVASPTQVPTVPVVTATDNCTDSVGVTFNQTLVATGTNCDYIITRTWTALDACGNVTRKTQQIFVKAPPLDIKAVHTDETCAKNDGTITMIPSSGITYIWSDGARGAFRTGLKAGSYTVTASAGLCEKTLTVIILDGCVCQTPVIATIAKTDATCGNSNGSVTVTPDNAANYTFTWSQNSPPGSGVTRSNLAAGFYTVTVTRTATPTCTTVLSVSVANNTANCCTQPIATVVKADATCGGSNGSAKIVVDNPANYTFTWSPNSPLGSGAGDTRSNLTAGTYSVTVSRINDAACLVAVTTTILNNTANCCVTPIATVTKADATCGESNGSATIAVDIAANYTFTWSSNASAGTGATRSNLAAGNYTVTVARVNNATCSTVANVTILNNTANCCTTPIATVTKTDATCGGSNGSASVTVDNPANYTFTWSANSPSGSGGSRSGLAAGTYSVTVSRTALPTCLTVVTTTIANNTGNCCTPPLAVVTKTDATCSESNGTASVAVVDGVANYTFTWSANASTATGTGASRTNLAPGDYTITVSRVGNPTCLSIVSTTIANNTVGCCNIIFPTSIVKVLTDCNGTAEVCVEIAPARLVNYTITNNGAPYTGGFGTCLAGSTLNLPAGQHRLIFTNNLIANCKDTLDVKVACVREMSASRTIALPATNEYCLTPSGLGLTGTIVSVVNECAASANNAQITINSTTWCVSYKALSVGIDTACLKITTSTGDVANMKLFINVTASSCARFINQDSVMITNACTDSTKACVNIPFDMITDYSVTLNGANYTGLLEGCKKDTTQSYNLFVLTRGGAMGPYNLNSWTVNGRTFSANGVTSLQVLVDSMNRFDPTGRWLLNNGTNNVEGGNLRNTYSSMSITTVSTNGLNTVALNQAFSYRATSVSVLRGSSKLVFTNRLSGCSDSLTINAACITPQRIETTMLKGKTDTFCIDTRQLIGTRYRIQTLATSTGRFVNYSNLSGTTCVNRAALNVGTERITYTVSDEYGMTDTIYVTTHVTESALLARRPIAINDKATTTKAKPVYVDVMTNDSIFTNRGAITIIKEPKRGTAIVMSDFRILYTPNADYCNAAKPDILTYTVCNQAGCDTATVEVTVVCDKLKVFNGFSPNNDGVNDFFVIEGAENFAKNTLTIYNRWGTAVLDTKGYKNDWSGNWDGKAVPDGTYFYIFNDGEGNQISGYIQIQR